MRLKDLVKGLIAQVGHHRLNTCYRLKLLTTAGEVELKVPRQVALHRSKDHRRDPDPHRTGYQRSVIFRPENNGDNVFPFRT